MTKEITFIIDILNNQGIYDPFATEETIMDNLKNIERQEKELKAKKEEYIARLEKMRNFENLINSSIEMLNNIENK
ncbi:MAG: hypothetical protein E3J43_08645 [Candidatus Heimdallarchaeota archaeon]|nr:MAG: hypothetical protein E3J43_08645 [Candidatus Heimdallarchaeota archaeon]